MILNFLKICQFSHKFIIWIFRRKDFIGKWKNVKDHILKKSRIKLAEREQNPGETIIKTKGNRKKKGTKSVLPHGPTSCGVTFFASSTLWISIEPAQHIWVHVHVMDHQGDNQRPFNSPFDCNRRKRTTRFEYFKKHQKLNQIFLLFVVKKTTCKSGFSFYSSWVTHPSIW